MAEVDERLDTGGIAVSGIDDTPKQAVAGKCVALATKLEQTGQDAAGLMGKVALHSVNDILRDSHWFSFTGNATSRLTSSSSATPRGRDRVHAHANRDARGALAAAHG